MTETQPSTGSDAPAGPDGPRVDPGRPVDPKAAELRAERNPLKRLFKSFGPGLITGASDDDPSGIGTSRLIAAAIAPMSAPAFNVLAMTRAMTAG